MPAPTIPAGSKRVEEDLQQSWKEPEISLSSELVQLPEERLLVLEQEMAWLRKQLESELKHVTARLQVVEARLDPGNHNFKAAPTDDTNVVPDYGLPLETLTLSLEVPDAHQSGMDEAASSRKSSRSRTSRKAQEFTEVWFEESAWSIPLLAGLVNLGVFDTLFASALVFLNLGMQSAFSIILLTPAFMGEEFESKIQSAKAWRTSVAHDERYMDLAGTSLVTRVCKGDGSVILSTVQATLVEHVNSFLGMEKDGFDLPAFQPGILLCMLCIVLWALCVYKEFRRIWVQLEAAAEIPKARPESSKGMTKPTLAASYEAETKLKAISAEVAKVDAEAKQAVSQASALGNNQSNMQSLLQAEQLLQPHSTAMMEVQRKLQDAQKGHPGDIARNFSQLANQLRMTQQQAQQLTNKFRQSRIQAESQAKMAEAELRETKAFEDMMPDVSQKCTAAEEAIEKAIATHEAIASSSDGDNQVSASVEETEAAVKEAEKAATEASVILQAKMNQIRRFESPKVRDNSAQELQKVQQKLQSAQSKLQPLKSVRQELAQRVAAQQALKEIQEKMAPLEEDFAAAEEAAVPVSSGDATEEQQAAAEQALQKVQDQLAALKRLCQTKKQPGGLVLAAVAKELASPEERIADFDVKLKALQDTKRQSGERLALKALAMDADQRLHALTEALQKVQDLQAPLNSEEELPAAKALQSLRVLEGPVTACGTAASVAKIFLMVKSVEVNNFSPLLAAEGQAKIKQFQIQLEEMTKRLAEVKSKAAEQKKLAYTKEAQRLSKRAEELATQVGEAVADLADDAKLSSLSREEIRKAQAAAVKAEEEGTGAVRQAKAALSQWQREDAAGESAQELSELHERVDNARSAMTKHARVSKSVDQRLDALQMVEEKLAKMTELESQATRMSDIIAKVSEADADASQLQKAEDAVKILQREVRSQSRDVDNQLQSRDEALRDLAEKLRDRLTPIVAKMDGALSTLRPST
eukprot:s2_g58.t1